LTMQLGILYWPRPASAGIGIEPPGAACGALVNDGYRYLLRNPVLSFASRKL
jgi:hypothetical protein